MPAEYSVVGRTWRVTKARAAALSESSLANSGSFRVAKALSVGANAVYVRGPATIHSFIQMRALFDSAAYFEQGIMEILFQEDSSAPHLCYCLKKKEGASDACVGITRLFQTLFYSQNVFLAGIPLFDHMQRGSRLLHGREKFCQLQPSPFSFERWTS